VLPKMKKYTKEWATHVGKDAEAFFELWMDD
jgi:hypothetical protein